ncbi:MAG: hypothetical protein HY581_12295 [Nitrospirae bacterium]|nr:hypothetical protein [Nitrospirota bacterium]
MSIMERNGGSMRSSAPRLSRHPFHGSPEWKPSGIPVAVVYNHGAVVSTGFPSPDAGWAPPLRQRALQTACCLFGR